MKEHILGELEKTRRTLALIAGDQLLLDEIAAVAETMIVALRGGHKVMLAGNGGSAADAQHIAGEFVSRFLFDRPGLAAMALTTDTSILTASATTTAMKGSLLGSCRRWGAPVTCSSLILPRDARPTYSGR